MRIARLITLTMVPFYALPASFSARSTFSGLSGKF